MSALPFYLAVVVRGHFLPHGLLPPLLIAGCVGVIGLAAALIRPPQDLSSLGGSPGPHWSVLAPYVAYTMLLVGALLQGTILWLVGRVMGGGLGPRPYYGMRLPLAWEMALLLMPYLVAALCTSLATADPSSRHAALLSRGSRWLLTVAGYYHLLDSLWGFLSTPFRIAGVAALPIGALVLDLAARRATGRREDSPAAREIGWLGRRWESAVFIRDLRVTLRTAGLRRQGVLSLLNSLLLPVALGALWTWLPGIAPLRGLAGEPWLTRFLITVGIGLAVVTPVALLTTFAALGSKAAHHWRAEHRFGTLPQLLASPMSAEEVLWGRWTASAVVGAPGALSTALLFLVSVGVVAQLKSDLLAPYLLLNTYLASVGLLQGALAAGAGEKSSWVQTAGGLLFIAECALVWLGILAWSGGGPIRERTPVFLFGTVVMVLNLTLAYLIYRCFLERLRQLRYADLG